MEMFYQDDTLFVDLSGYIDILNVRLKLFNITNQYKINNVIISVGDVFNYKRSAFSELKNDYTRMYGGNIIIKK